jgi:hypothetical protein
MKRTTALLFLLFAVIGAYGQEFEESVTGYEGLKKPEVKIGADFAMQFQFLNHHADSTLIPLGKGINVPTANLNLDAILADGIKVNLTTYLSSRHHPEAWVKGGYLLLDKLPFIKSEAITRAMDFLTIKIGAMEINYGDAHFRRSDNGNIIRNRFVGNYIMDGFTTAPALEAWYKNKGILLLAGLTDGTLDPILSRYNAASHTYSAINLGNELAFYWKAGYDRQITDDIRVRATMSGYHAANNHSGSLYFGDRTGSRYYLVMNRETNSSSDVDPSVNHLSGNFGPGFSDRDNSLMWNLFTRCYGLEFFGTYELATGTSASSGASFRFNQYAAEGIYHFGNQDQFYGGVRYNHVKNSLDNSVERVQVSAGWYLLPEILVKAEYVDQNYKNFALYGGNAGFNGLMLEATISF